MDEGYTKAHGEATAKLIAAELTEKTGRKHGVCPADTHGDWSKGFHVKPEPTDEEESRDAEAVLAFMNY